MKIENVPLYLLLNLREILKWTVCDKRRFKEPVELENKGKS